MSKETETKVKTAKKPEKVKKAKEGIESPDVQAELRARADKFYEAKKFVREKELNNLGYIYVVFKKDDIWWKMYDNSAFFYRALSNEVVKIKQEKMDGYGLLVTTKEPSITESMLKPVKIRPDQDGKYRSNYCASANGENNFKRRLEGIKLKEEKVPEEFKNNMRIFKLPNPFSKEDINNFHAEEQLLKERVTHICYGKNVDVDLLKKVRRTSASLQNFIRKDCKNKRVCDKIFEEIVMLRTFFQYYCKYARTNPDRYKILKRIHRGTDYLSVYIDLAVEDRAIEMQNADELSLMVMDLAEAVASRMIKIDKNALDELAIYEDLKNDTEKRATKD